MKTDFKNVPYLNQMGANIEIDNRKLKITGKTELKPATVVATDLRAGACLILAALTANGTTCVNDVEHVLRGYENIVQKLTDVGANLKLQDE